MDPVTAAGIGLGAVSLTFQIFSGCIKVYQLLADAHGMPTNAEYLRVRLKTEQHRLLDWAGVADLTEKNESLPSSSRSLAWDVLHQKELLLAEFVRTELRSSAYKDHLTTNTVNGDHRQFLESKDGDDVPRAQFPQKNMSLLEKSLKFIDAGRKYPGRLRWAAFDQKRFEKLLEKLHALNDYMKELLNSNQIAKLAVAQQQTLFQIMQLNNRVDTLIQIVMAGRSLNYHSGAATFSPAQAFMQMQGLLEAPGAIEQNSTGMQLAHLARSKVLNESIDQGTMDASVVSTLGLEASAQDLKKTEISQSALDYPGQSSNGARCEATYFSDSSVGAIKVWIEWKELDTIHPVRADDGKESPHLSPTWNEAAIILERVQKLAAFLRENRNLDFRVPHCLGYTLDTDTSQRVGYVFEKPAEVDQDSVPVSLLQMLRDRAVAKPSLTKRISLILAVAETLQHMHAINWLHKGIRSDNVMFFPRNNEVDYSQPYVSGFDYSRPARSEEMTEIPKSDPKLDIYRHPRVQGGPRDGSKNKNWYKKTYDIYSLGVVMLEVAHWESLQDILKIPSLATMKGSDTRRVYKLLLGDDHGKSSEYLHTVGSNAGEKYQEVIRTCLAARDAFELDREDDQTSEDTGLKIQNHYFEKVVNKLRMIVV